jgi:geranylgeranyl diphosphate synthase, type II
MVRPVSELSSLIETRLNELDLNRTPHDLYQPVSYMLSLRAKRTRPVLLLAGCDMFGGNLDHALSPAAGIEVFHNFTLLHDDIMDNAPLRRSHQTVHKRWNPNVAILSGDAMFVLACQLMMQTRDECLREVLEIFHRTAIEVCEGQQMDMDFERMEKVSIQDYIHMITLKTAVLLGCSLKIGAEISGAAKQDSEHVYEFGKNIGIAFQLRDDLLDVFGEGTKVGKQTGGDILACKKTFLWLKASEIATGTERENLIYWFHSTNEDPGQRVHHVKAVYESLGLFELAQKEMEKYYNIAMHHLDAIEVIEENKSVLSSIAGKLMVREH